KIANGGKLYSQDTTGQWYEYSGSQFLSWVDPALESTRSADGTVVQAGSGRGLVTKDGVWTFSTGKTSAGNYILLNGKVAGYAAASSLAVANGGNLYSLNAQGQWFQWTGANWLTIANPDFLIAALVSDTGRSTTDGITSDPMITGIAQANLLVT